MMHIIFIPFFDSREMQLEVKKKKKKDNEENNLNETIK